MAIEVERLVATLEARIDKYEKSLAKAQSVTGQQFGAIERRGKLMETRLATLGSTAFTAFARRATSVLAPLLTVTAIVNKTKEALRDFGAVADNSAAAGLDPELYQSLAYQFQQVGVEASQTASALATFAKNSGLAAEGKGRMVTQLKALDAELLVNIQRARTQDERIRLVADALAKTTDESKRAAIAAAAFGDAGVKMVAAFEGGAASIDETLRKAKDLGLVVDRELIARADELGDEFDTVSQVLDTQIKSALVRIAPLLTGLVGLAAQFAGWIGDAARFWGQIASGDFSKVMGETAQSRLAAQLAGLQSERTSLDLAGALGANSSGTGIRDALMGAGVDLSNQVGPGARYGDIAELFGIRPATAAAVAPAAPSLFDPIGGEGLSFDRLTDKFDVETRRKAAAAAIKQADAVKELIAELEFEHEQLGRNGLEQEVMNTLRRAGVDAMSTEGLRIRELITGNQALADSQELVNEQIEFFADLAKSSVRSFIDDLREGKSAAEALGNVLGNIGDRLLDFGLTMGLNMLFGGGPGALFAGLFGGMRAGGGPVSPGKVYGVGERGPELFAPSVPGTIVPNGGRGGTETVRIELAADPSIMVGVADQRIALASGTIVQVAVTQAGRSAPAALAHYRTQRAGGEYRV